MRDDELLDQLADADSVHEAIRPFLFHGTGEAFEGGPGGGGYDGVFWCADSPAVAQCYIPAAGMESLMSMSDFRLADRVRPDKHSDWYAMVCQMGLESPDVEWDDFGRAKSFACPTGYPTYGDVCDWVEGTLGYENTSRAPHLERAYRVKARFEDGLSVHLPAAFKAPGRLFIVEGARDLKFLDMASGREGDLMDLDYHKVAAFRSAEAEGYDGVIINDFCQSRNHGNVGHVSWGLLPAGLAKVRHAIISVHQFDWAENEPCTLAITPEFEAAWNERRMAVGKRLA